MAHPVLTLASPALLIIDTGPGENLHVGLEEKKGKTKREHA